jgi:hypothetical protein
MIRIGIVTHLIDGGFTVKLLKKRWGKIVAVSDQRNSPI